MTILIALAAFKLEVSSVSKTVPEKETLETKPQQLSLLPPLVELAVVTTALPNSQPESFMVA